MAKFKTRIYELNGDRMLINACKKANFSVYNPRGPWNGYGYTKLPMVVEVQSYYQLKIFKDLKTKCEEKRRNKKKKNQKEIIEIWARRLSRLAEINYDYALEIANEKLKAKERQIDELNDRQSIRGYSKRRQSLIDKLARSNPLRYIKDEHHARSIVVAHNRHSNTDYDTLLKEIHELEDETGLHRGKAKTLARALINNEITYNEMINMFM